MHLTLALSSTHVKFDVWTGPNSCFLSRQTGFFYTLQAEPPFLFFLIEEEKSAQPELLD